MFYRVSEWLDVVLETDIPNEVVAFGFNLYEEGHYNWSMELIGASEFDIDDEDWLCNEATDFNTRDNPLQWHKEAGCEEILNDVVCALKEYLKNGKHADILKAKSGVGVGFVDGNIEIIARHNIEANGEMLDRDFGSFCMPCLSEVQNEMQASQNEMSKAEKRITSSRSRSFVIGKESADMRNVAAFIIAIILIMNLFWVLWLIISNRNQANYEDTPQQIEDFEEETSMPSIQEKSESGQLKYQVYIQPDMPEPFIEVLRQYEEFMNADNQNLNDEDVQKKINSVDGEWRYLYDESWLAALRRGEEGVIGMQQIYFQLKQMIRKVENIYQFSEEIKCQNYNR